MWGTEYYPPGMMADIVAQSRQEIAAPVGLATTISGFQPGAPIDTYVSRCDVTMTVVNCTQIPCYGRWYCLEARFDGMDYDPQQQYANDIANIQGAVGSSLGQPLTADLIGTTPYNFRSVCETYKIRPMSKVFKLEGGQPRVFKHVSKRYVHVTPRFIGVNAVKSTKFFMFEFWGMPLNDSTTKNNVNTAAGAVDVVLTETTSYEYRPSPQTYKVFNSDVGVVTTPSVMAQNTLVPATAILFS